MHHSWTWFIVSVASSRVARESDPKQARVVPQFTKSPYSTTSSKRPTFLAGARGITSGNSKLRFNYAQVTTFLNSSRIEMNVGIVAACLPTLKPLAANFFGVVSALTSGERYGPRYGSRYGSNALSRPHISNSYMKHSERIDTQSYMMGEMRNNRTKATSPFEGQGPAESTARRGSSAAESD